MEKYELLKAVKAVCPQQCKVETLPTCRGSKTELAVVKYPPEAVSGNIYKDTAFVGEIEELHNKVLALQIPTKAYRIIYCSGNRFVLYTSCTDVLTGFVCYYRARHGISYKFEGKRGRRKYVGVCSDIESLINYLTTVKNVKF